jgi:hypothetical protein
VRCHNAAGVVQEQTLWVMGGYDPAEERNMVWHTSILNAANQSWALLE